MRAQLADDGVTARPTGAEGLLQAAIPVAVGVAANAAVFAALLLSSVRRRFAFARQWRALGRVGLGVLATALLVAGIGLAAPWFS